MLRGIVGWSARFRLVVIGLAVLACVVGIAQLRTMSVDVLPEFSPPYVEVQTEALGLSAEEVEELVTVPLEADLLNGVAWMDEIRSESIPGLSSIVITFEPGTDVIRARQMVAERLTQAHALPNVSKPPAMLQPLSSQNRLMIVALTSDELPLIDMSVLARWTIRPRLMGIPGVANVSIWGQRERQLQVLVDPRELQSQGVSLEHVIASTGNALWVSPLTFLEASTPGTGGFVETPNQRLGIQHILPIRSPEDLARVVVERDFSEAGQPQLRIGDVATVVEDHQPLIGDAVVGDAADNGLLLVIEKFPEVNALDVTGDVEAALGAMQPGLRGIEMDTTVFRPANFLEASLGNVSFAVLAGLLLAALALAILVFDWRATVIGLVAIPVSLLAAVLVLGLLGASLNVMVVAGLLAAIGVVVDDAIGGTESVLARPNEGRRAARAGSRLAVAIDSIVERRSTLAYATAIVLLALVPCLLVGGAAGAMMPSIAIAFGLAVLASTIVAMTLTPALASLVLWRAPGRRRQSPLIARLGQRYRLALAAALVDRRSPWLTGAAIALGVVALVAIALVPHPDGLRLPTFQARELLVHWDGAPGTSRVELARTVGRATAELRTIPGVANVGAHVGRAILSDAVTDVNRGEIWIALDAAADHGSTVAAVRDTIAGYPGLSTAALSYPEEQVGRFMAPAAHDVYVRVYGQDSAVLAERAQAVADALSSVPGLGDVVADLPEQQPEIEVTVDLAAAERYGIKAGDVRRIATTLLSGIETGLLYEEQKVFEVVVWGKPELRQSITSVENLPIETPTGQLVRLADVADVRVAPAATVVRREGVMRYVDVGGSVVGRGADAALADVRAAVAGVDFPQEYHAEVFSPAARAQDQHRLFLLTALAVALIAFLLAQAVTGSWFLTALFAASLPLALLGGIVAVAATGELASLGSLAGALVVIALAVRSGLVFIEHANRAKRDEGDAFDAGSLVRIAGDRMASILTVAVATGLALAPIVVLGGVAGLELARPMAVFVFGGVVSAALVSLFVVPTVYLHVNPTREADVERQSIEQLAFEPATE